MMFAWLAQFLSAPIINGFLAAYQKKLDASNTAGAQAVEVTKAALLAEIEARKSAQAVTVAEQGRWWTALPRAAVQWSLAIFIGKVVVWDTCLGWGSTPALGGDVAVWMGWIMGIWFGGRAVQDVATSVFRTRR